MKIYFWPLFFFCEMKFSTIKISIFVVHLKPIKTFLIDLSPNRYKLLFRLVWWYIYFNQSHSNFLSIGNLHLIWPLFNFFPFSSLCRMIFWSKVYARISWTIFKSTKKWNLPNVLKEYNLILGLIVYFKHIILVLCSKWGLKLVVNNTKKWVGIGYI